MENFNLILDLILIVMSLGTISMAQGFGGIVGRSFHLFSIACIVLGIAHVTETMLFRYTAIVTDMQEFIHRLIVLAGFTLLIMAFRAARQGKAPMKA